MGYCHSLPSSLCLLPCLSHCLLLCFVQSHLYKRKSHYVTSLKALCSPLPTKWIPNQAPLKTQPFCFDAACNCISSHLVLSSAHLLCLLLWPYLHLGFFSLFLEQHPRAALLLSPAHSPLVRALCLSMWLCNIQPANSGCTVKSGQSLLGRRN